MYILFFSVSSNLLSWKKSYSNLFRIQKHLFKAVIVGDFFKALKLQNLIITSNSARLLAIRETTQIGFSKKIAGIDGKTSLNFIERFQLNDFLRLNVKNWFPNKVKKTCLVESSTGNLRYISVYTVSDRTWQTLVSFSLYPANEANFHPRNFGFEHSSLLYDLQEIISLNLSKQAFGINKRILIVCLEKCFKKFSYDFSLRKIIAPRYIKLGISRFLSSMDFEYFCCNELSNFNILFSLLSNVVLNGVEILHPCVRFNFSILFFLNPKDNEKILMRRLGRFLSYSNLDSSKKLVSLFSSQSGFDFVDWNFKVLKNKSVFCVPSYLNYQKFLVKIKHIVNNSNYGSKVKNVKITPIIKDWRNYNKFCSLQSSRLSLFFVKRKVFEAFKKESKQDAFSVKKLLKISFSDFKINLNQEKIEVLSVTKLFYFDHLTFGSNFLSKGFICNLSGVLKLDNNFCIHCGMSTLK